MLINEIVRNVDMLFPFQCPERHATLRCKKSQALSSSKKRKIDFGDALGSTKGSQGDWETNDVYISHKVGFWVWGAIFFEGHKFPLCKAQFFYIIYLIFMLSIVSHIPSLFVGSICNIYIYIYIYNSYL